MDVEKIVRENIDRIIHMSLATSNGKAPWVCEVHFAFDEELNLYFRSLTSRRHSQEIAANPLVAGNIIDKHNLGDTTVGLYFEGKAELLQPGESQNIANECLTKRLKMDTDSIKEASDPEGHQFYKISVSSWYVFGKFGKPNSAKFKLDWNS